jgi:uncharacterized membrane protein
MEGFPVEYIVHQIIVSTLLSRYFLSRGLDLEKYVDQNTKGPFLEHRSYVS